MPHDWLAFFGKDKLLADWERITATRTFGVGAGEGFLDATGAFGAGISHDL